METINIVFATDNNYAQHLGVALCSIFENKTSPNLIDIYILDGGISPENKYKLELISKQYSFKMYFINVDLSIFKDSYISGYVTHAAYYRMKIPDFLPDINKALYLDCDVLVLGDIFKLYNININNYICAAVNEEIYKLTKLKNLNIPPNGKYFNSGVLLINLNRWRLNKISDKVIKFINENKKKYETKLFEYYDQDALNAVLYGNWLNISNKYNFLKLVLKEKQLRDFKNRNILIIHYIGIKPWNYLYFQKLNIYYFYYLNKSPWKNEAKIIDKTIKKIILKSIIKVVLFLSPLFIIRYILKLKRYLNIKFY